MKSNKGLKRILPAVFLIFLFPVSGINGEPSRKTIHISSWLRAGPVHVSMPFFHEVKNMKGETFGLFDLLGIGQACTEPLFPSLIETFSLTGTGNAVWEKCACDTSGLAIEPISKTDMPQLAFVAAHIDVNRFTRAELKVSGFHVFQVFLDGEKIMDKKTADAPGREGEIKAGSVSREIDLENGNHVLLIKTLRDPSSGAPWNIRGKLEVPDSWEETSVQTGFDPFQRMTLGLLLDSIQPGQVSISADGEIAAIPLQQVNPPDAETEYWTEFRRVKDGSLIQTYRGGIRLSSLTWAPQGHRFSYITSDKEEQTLWIVDLDAGSCKPVLRNIKRLDGHTWSPDGTYLIYSVSEEPKKEDTGLRKVEGMPDRQPGWRERSFLYRIQLPSGSCQRLTAGRLTTSLSAISPDGSRLVFSRSRENFLERPYRVAEFFLLDLKSLSLDTLWISPWIDYVASWSPDGNQLLVIGGPMAFDGAGNIVPEGMIPNDFDKQAFIYDLQSRRVDPVTRDFHPSISQAVWSKTENALYFTATDGPYERLFRYDIGKRSFRMLNTGVEVIDRLDIASMRPVAVYTGSGVSMPPAVYAIDLRKNAGYPILKPQANDYRHIEFGRSERWTFRNARGMEIEGHVYYPPDFSSDKKYPCIVYYYGGTTPVTRDFGGRYPKEVYAANGYVVYVLQPSGAIGFGQAFSSLHVNDWGTVVADEIIDGVKQFVNAHPFVDRERLGCIGASYGGFMTMLLVTKTDIFRAAISHAGISSISSYWGEGFWGYEYSATATANSFPWNRKDIYIDQSPLFHADNVRTPLLLLHGKQDTNVPPGESIQFYTALKLLGKEVELVEVEDQNHHIMDYRKRMRWTKTILSWFDRWLKDQPEWWESLYPAP